MSKKIRSQSEVVGWFIPYFKENFRERAIALKYGDRRRRLEIEDEIVKLCQGLLAELPGRLEDEDD